MGLGGFFKGLKKTAIIIGKVADNPAIKTVLSIWVPPLVLNIAIKGATALEGSGKTNGQKHQELKEQLMPSAELYGLGPTEVDQLIKAVVAQMRGKGKVIAMMDDSKPDPVY